MDNIYSIIQLQDTSTSPKTCQFSPNQLWHQQQQIIQPQGYHHHYHQLFSMSSQEHGINDDQCLTMVGDKTEEVGFKRSKSSSCIDFRSSKDDENSSVDHHQSFKRKKIVHRNIERQRRQDMTSLYTSLRSLLPLEYLKGKRSISDQIHEAANYIKHMEENIRKMGEKRNELKKGLASSGLESSMEAMEGNEKDNLMVEACCLGVEVTINTCTSQQQKFPLSRVLAILTQQGLNVVSCISTKLNQRMLHSIKSEVSEGSNINMSDLQQKLNNSVIQRFAD